MTSVVSFVTGVVLVTKKVVYGYSVEGLASVMTSMFFLAGLLLFVFRVSRKNLQGSAASPPVLQ